jgi:RimJ/RimL family protein N-acetyltransferase
MTQVETARLVLRPWQPGDLTEFIRLLTDPVVTRYIVVQTPFSPEDVAELHERTLDQWDRNGFGPWAAIEKATGLWVGRIGLDELPDWPGPHKVEVGWELHREFWGRGLATEGGRAGVRHGFETVGLKRIISATMATNAASRRVMEKCGLRFQASWPWPGQRWPGTRSTGPTGRLIRPALWKPAAGHCRLTPLASGPSDGGSGGGI